MEVSDETSDDSKIELDGDVFELGNIEFQCLSVYLLISRINFQLQK